LDVHGNQYGLLTASKCFMASKMDCTTCHDPHRRNDRPLKSYATICMSCHQNPEKLHALSTLQTQGGLVNKCINCHMPAQPSDAISIQAIDGEKMVPYLVRNHFIKIYRSLPASNRL
jgi:predicted CXXCH cytochrome family protein